VDTQPASALLEGGLAALQDFADLFTHLQTLEPPADLRKGRQAAGNVRTSAGDNELVGVGVDDHPARPTGRPDTLVDTGHADVAFRVLPQTSAPSWLHAIELGATTTWETWEGYKQGEPEASHNHYAFGAVAAFLQERIAGLAPAAPGYARLRIAPVIGGGLTSAAISIHTPYGQASSAWERDDSGAVTLTVQVPTGV